MDPLGQSQILPYLKGLSQTHPVHWHILSFEKNLNCLQELHLLQKMLKSYSIDWSPLPYHRRFSIFSKIYDIARGLGHLQPHLKTYQFILARSYVACCLAFLCHKIYKIPFIFDMRGFWPEERVDGGLWKRNGMLFKITKQLERSFIRHAEAIIVLTQKAALELHKNHQYPTPRQVSIIPTCVDTDHFSHPNIERMRTASPGWSFCYAGSIGTWYCLNEMILFIRFLRSKEIPARLKLLINATSQNELQTYPHLRDSSFIEILGSSYAHMPQALQNTDFGIYFIRPSYSKISSCPTKLGEFLAMGIPVITNRGIGDCDEWIEAHTLGILLEDFAPASFEKAYQQLLSLKKDAAVQQRCIEFVNQHLSLKLGVQKYNKVIHNVREKNSISGSLS